MGLAIHAGQVIVADGTPEMEQRLERVLTNDPGIGVIRHADAGYSRAQENVNRWNVDVPMMDKHSES
jgi:urocanate hydratase